MTIYEILLIVWLIIPYYIIRHSIENKIKNKGDS